MVNINNKIRSIIVKIIEDGYMNGIDAIETSQIITEQLFNIYRTSFACKFNIESIGNYAYFWLFTEICYLDSIKYYNYLDKNLMLNDEDQINYYILKQINDDMELMAQVSYNPDLFAQMIENSYKYTTSKETTKDVMIKSLSNEENVRLLSMCKEHQNDLDEYGRDIQVELDDLINSYQESNEYNKKVLNIFDDTVSIGEIVSYIRKIYELDTDNFFGVADEIYDIDYLITSYIKDKTDDPIIKEHYEIYENYEIDEIFGLYVTNNSFLEQAIANIIDLYINKRYDDIELDIDNILRLKRD